MALSARSQWSVELLRDRSEPDWHTAASQEIRPPFHQQGFGRSDGNMMQVIRVTAPMVYQTEYRRETSCRMRKPKRIQRSRAKGWKMPANAIYVGRPTVWGNPYVVGSQLMNGETLTAEKAIALYEQHLANNFNERDIRHCLHGKDLACWCALDQPCHADVLLEIANSRPK